LTDAPRALRDGGSRQADAIDDRLRARDASPSSYARHVDQEVAKTLSELELKLQELERALTSLGQRDTPRRSDTTLPHGQANAPGRLIDEAFEGEREQGSDEGRDPQERTAEEAVADGDGFGGPAVWGGEEVPAQAGATVERDWSVEVRETAYGEIPIPPPRAIDAAQTEWPPAPTPPHVSEPPRAHSASQVPPPPHAPPLGHHPYAPAPTERQSVDVAELVEFKEKLQRTLDGLIAEYGRLLSPKPPA
jgi:hypothetical protein